MDDLGREFEWIGFCARKIDVTNVGSQHDLTDLLTPTEEIKIDGAELLVENSNS